VALVTRRWLLNRHSIILRQKFNPLALTLVADWIINIKSTMMKLMLSELKMYTVSESIGAI
jgi:hypothetical protein